MPNQLKLSDLQNAVRGSAAYRCRTKLHPIGDDGEKVFPPTYAGGVYAVEDRRIDGRIVRCVLLDSVQSQANRMENALQDYFLPNWRELSAADTDCELPVIAVYIENHGWVTSLTAPHRVHDAILRDSNLNGTRFRDSAIGRTIVDARLHNATAFYRYCPTALLFGTWDSTAGEGLDAAKIPRAVVSEIIGVDITPGVRTGSRIDPLGIRAQSATVYRRRDGDWALQDGNGGWIGAKADEIEKDDRDNPRKFKKGKPSDINHGNVTPDMPRFDRDEIRKQNLNRLTDILESNPLRLQFDIESANSRLKSHSIFDSESIRIRPGAVKPGGVTIAHGLHTWVLSLTQLRNLRFPVNGQPSEDRNNAARTALAATALFALALQRERGYWLRSRCELVRQTGADSGVLEEIKTDGTRTPFALPPLLTTQQLLEEALQQAEKEGNTRIAWEKKIIRLTPTEKLLELVRRSDARQGDEDTEKPEDEGTEVEAAGAGD